MPDSNTKKGVPKGPLWKFFLCDILVTLTALFLSFLIRFQEIHTENFQVYKRLIFLILIIRLGTLYLFRLYDFRKKFVTFDILYFTGAAMITAHAIEFLTILYSGTFNYTPIHPHLFVDGGNQSFQISRYVILLNFVLSWTGTSAWRIFYIRRRRRWAYDITRILIVGAGELGESVQSDIKEYSRQGHRVVGLVDDDIEPPSNSSPVLGKMNDLDALVKEHKIDEIIVTSRMANRQELLEILSVCHSTNCKVRLLPELYEVTIGQVEVEQVGGVPLITTNPKQVNEIWMFFKRTLDILCAIPALIILLFLLPVIAFAIKSSSPGSVFYRQKRVGKDGTPFYLYKFRTMHEDAEHGLGPVLSWEEDPRVHRTGSFLRRWHIDELPQFWNILKGEMSLVGPRPERPHFSDKHAQEIAGYRLRETIRPGMTGLAQIHGFYSSPIEHKLRYDLAYINASSFLLDCKILFLTLRMLFSHHQPV